MEGLFQIFVNTGRTIQVHGVWDYSLITRSENLEKLLKTQLA